MESISNILDKFLNDNSLKNRIVTQKYIPPKEGVYYNPKTPLTENGLNILEKMNIEKLYSHQADTYDNLRNGNNVILVTPTASGKTLSFNLPIIEHLINNPKAKALYIYPTKALAQDQKQKIEDLNLGIKVGIYDGDVDKNDRKKIKEECQIIITNPDMLHVAILPHHRTWSEFLTNLSFVVIDEMHIYRGVFGCHVSLIFRRLRRLCGILYNNNPQFVGCSATIAKANEFAEKLVGVPFSLVDKNGAPSGGKHFIIWNPPLVDLFKGVRRSLVEEGALIFKMLTEEKIKTIAFMKSRQGTEKLMLNSKKELGKKFSSKIQAYRGGYTAEDRRKIEKSLFNDELIGVVATSALEVGIDIGGIDTCMIVGYPGTIASTWQQAGRAGRSGSEALIFLITANDPLDQYFATNPDIFFDSPVEHPIIDPYNPNILRKQIDCLLYEFPWFERYDKDIVGEKCHSILEDMLANEEVEVKDTLVARTAKDYPAFNVNIRSASGNEWKIKNMINKALIGTSEEYRVFQQLHPEAIYLHQGDMYKVTTLEFETRTVWVIPTDADYYTYALTQKDVQVLKVLKQKKMGECYVYYGDILRKEQTIGFAKKFANGQETKYSLVLPEQNIVTKAFWWTIPTHLEFQIKNVLKYDLGGTVHAMEHAAIAMLPLFAMCDRWDIGGMSYDYNPMFRKPTIFIYDGYEGGIGYSEKGYEKIEELLQKTLDSISNCTCKSGCPSCIYSPKCGNGNKPLDKMGAQYTLEKILEK